MTTFLKNHKLIIGIVLVVILALVGYYMLTASGATANATKEKADAQLAAASSSIAAEDTPWKSYEKPARSALKEELSRGVFRVTQNDGTEVPYSNELYDETRDGIYVDILSGEPLFSSKHKYRSNTGWPSFTKPLAAENIVTKDDTLLGYKRVEVRSKYGDNHLGHVFNDGPTTEEASDGAAPTGLRYCLNSAALRFIPKDELAEEGYAAYEALFAS